MAVVSRNHYRPTALLWRA